MKKAFTVITATLLISVFAPEASAKNEVKKELTPLTEVQYQNLEKEYSRGSDCIFSRSIHNWTPLDRKSMIIYAPSKKRPYYVKLHMSVHSMKFNHTIGLYSRFDNRFCAHGGNAVLIDGQRYSIRSIQKITPLVAQQMIAFNKKKKTKKADEVSKADKS